IAAQVMLAFLLAAASTLLTSLLHDEIPSSLRAGATSGVDTLTWITFLPFALGFGFLSRHSSIHTAACMHDAANAATCIVLLRLTLSRHPDTSPRHRALPTATDPLTSLAQAEC